MLVRIYQINMERDCSKNNVKFMGYDRLEKL